MFIIQDSKELDFLLKLSSKLWIDYDENYQKWLMKKNKLFNKINRKVSSKANDEFKQMSEELSDKEKKFNCITNLYEELVGLDQCYYGYKYKTKTIYDEDTYYQCQKIYKKTKMIIDKLSNEESYNPDEILKYTKFVSLAKKYCRKVGFFTIVNNYDVEVKSDDVNKLAKDNFELVKIVRRAFEEEWDYHYFINFISIYQKYEDMVDEAYAFFKKQKYLEILEEAKLNKCLEDNPTYVILHNSNVLKDNLFSRKMLLEVKRKIYEQVRDCDNLDVEEAKLETIKAINLRLRKESV